MPKLIKNWSYLLFSDFSLAGINFFVFMFLARKLSPESFGSLNTILALAALLSIFTVNLSANQVITREVTLHPHATKRIFNLVYPIRLISLLITIIALIIYEILSADHNLTLIFAISLIVIATLIWDLAESIAFGHFVTKFTTIISVAASLCWFIIIVFLPSKSISLVNVIIIYALILFFRSIIYIVFSFINFIKLNNKPISIGWKAIFLMSLPYFWMRIVGAFGDQVPILLLEDYSGSAEVGFYSVGNRFVLPITIVVSTGLRAMFPFMTKLFQEDKEKFKDLLIRSFTLVLILGSSIAMLLTISSGILIPFFFGIEYNNSVLAFNYQAWFGVLLCFDLVLSTVLSSTYKQKIIAIITTIDILIIFPLMYYGVKYGAEGMAMAKLIGSFVVVCYHIIVVVMVLKVKLNSVSFVYSFIYFISFLVITIFISDIVIKTALIFTTILLFMIYKESPLRQLIKLVSQRIIK